VSSKSWCEFAKQHGEILDLDTRHGNHPSVVSASFQSPGTNDAVHSADADSLVPAEPVMGRLLEWQNGYIASRFGGDGVCMSPATGERMAELIDTGKVPLRARRMPPRLVPGAASG
jgi:hypothetical protein